MNCPACGKNDMTKLITGIEGENRTHPAKPNALRYQGLAFLSGAYLISAFPLVEGSLGKITVSAMMGGAAYWVWTLYKKDLAQFEKGQALSEMSWKCERCDISFQAEPAKETD